LKVTYSGLTFAHWIRFLRLFVDLLLLLGDLSAPFLWFLPSLLLIVLFLPLFLIP